MNDSVPSGTCCLYLVEGLQIIFLITHFSKSMHSVLGKIIITESKFKSIHFETLEITFPVITPFCSKGSVRFFQFG